MNAGTKCFSNDGRKVV